MQRKISFKQNKVLTIWDGKPISFLSFRTNFFVDEIVQFPFEWWDKFLTKEYENEKIDKVNKYLRSYPRKGWLFWPTYTTLMADALVVGAWWDNHGNEFVGLVRKT